jgi:hypothetical protein
MDHVTRFSIAILLGACAPVGTESEDETTSALPRESPFGVVAHAADNGMIDRFVDIGIGWYRVDCEWSQNEPADGVFDFGNSDRMVSHLEGRGAFTALVVSYTPSWASGTTDPASPPRDPSRFVAYVREVARRYRGRAGCIGIWNEPNLRQFWAGSKQQYLHEILVPSLRAVKEEAPEMLTCGPDLSSSGDERNDWMGPILDAAGPLLDIITHHQYDGSDTPSGRVREIERMHEFLAARGHGHKPLWITEIGWDSPRFSRSRQASYLRDVMRAMQGRPWWQKTFWYDSHGAGWGLFEGDATTPSFDAYRDVISASPFAPRPDPGPVDPPPGPGGPPSGASTLEANGTLRANDSLVSSDGRFRLTYQGDGNLVLYGSEGALWATYTFDAADLVVMQGDGNLVMYSGGRAVWSTGTHGNDGARLALQNDGNLVVYSASGAALWSSGTCCR